MTKRATIKDVAALAGVSFATVSRALDDRPEISAETKRKVREACEALGYVPNAAARGLAGQATHTIGLVVPDISNQFFAETATAVEQRAAEAGYRVLLGSSMRDAELELQTIDSLLARQIDGILISAISPETQSRHPKELADFPCVYFGENHDWTHSCVRSDNYKGAYLAASYLLDLGHRDILFLGGRESSRTRSVRFQGFQDALRERGVAWRSIPAPDSAAQMRRWSYETALDLLAGPLPDAIFAYSDLTALKILEAAEERGVRVPEDVSLLGYDNILAAALPRIHLTTVSQKKSLRGRLAVERLLEQIQGSREVTVDVLEPELIIRSSCRPNEKGGPSLERDTQ